jgi:hypothetical protein
VNDPAVIPATAEAETVDAADLAAAGELSARTEPALVHHRRRSRLRGWLLAPDHLVPFLVIMAITLFFWYRTIAHLATYSQSAGGEEGLYLFWLGHFPWAVSHGHNPLFTTAANYPAGVNATWNTSLLTLGVILAPLTQLFGVVFAFNVALIGGTAGTALACYAACRRFVRWWPAALAGGLIAGFGPYMLTQGRGHIHLDAAIPALFVLVGHELLVRQRCGRVRLGLLMGFLVILQFGISTEVLASIALVGVIGALVAGALYPHQVNRERLKYAAIALGVGAVSALVVLAWPLYVLFAGPQHLTGPAQIADRFSADLLSPVVPTGAQQLAPPSLVHRAATFSGNGNENTAYLGITLLLAVVCVVVLLRRSRTVVWAAVMALATFVISLGRTLRVDGHNTGFPLPWDLITRLPLMESAAAVRYSFYTTLFAGIVLALGADALATRYAAAQWSARRRSVVAFAGVAAWFLVALPLVPNFGGVPYHAARISVPAWFTARDGVQRVPENSVAVLYPYLSRFESRPMTYQAFAKYRFRQPGDYGITPAADGKGTFDTPTVTHYVESRLAIGVSIKPNFAVIPQMLAEWRAWGVRTVVVVDSRPGAKQAEELYTAILHQQPVHSGGVAAYYDIKL